MKTIDHIPMINFRKRRAEAFAAALMEELSGIETLGDVDLEEIHYRILSVLHDNGAAWTTDEERERFGFEPRDALGWTPSERVAEKHRRLEMMLMLTKIVTPA